MNVTEQIMEILKNDEKANKLMARFDTAATGANLQGAEYDEARKTMLMLIIANTPAALEVMANEMWEEVNAI